MISKPLGPVAEGSLQGEAFPLSSYVFPGFPAFLESASAELGCREAAGPARRIVPFTALANLCAQAAHGDPAHVAGILAKAAEFRDQLATALRAAEMMLADVEAGRRPSQLAETKGDIDHEAETELTTTTPSARSGRKATRTS